MSLQGPDNEDDTSTNLRSSIASMWKNIKNKVAARKKNINLHAKTLPSPFQKLAKTFPPGRGAGGGRTLNTMASSTDSIAQCVQRKIN